MFKRLPRALLFLTLLILTGCAPRIGAGQSSIAAIDLSLENGRTVGQTFTALHAGLSGIEVYLLPGSPGDGSLVLHLRENPSGEEVASAQLPSASITAEGFHRFSFPIQKDSYLKDYYLELENPGGEAVGVGYAGGDTYVDGALYRDGQAVDSQLGFRLVYDTPQLVLGLAGWGWSVLVVLLQAGFLFILPGWALLAAFWPDWGERFWGEKLGLAAGVSLALYPVMILWTDLANLHLGAIYAWLPGVLAALYILYRIRPYRKTSTVPLKARLIRAWKSDGFWADLAFIAACLLIAFVRFYTVRTLAFPMWGDSYHHTMIAQLLVENRGLFDSWQPYADLQTLTYHFGFHAAAAVFHWVSQASLPQATLWVGQALNTLAVLSIYPLATLVGKSRWAGAAAVVVAGLLLPMPMFYSNWGRYTQLAGQVILPAVVWMCWWIFQGRGWSRSTLIKVLGLCCMTLGGLALTHYRILIFAALFFPALLLLYIRRNSWKTFTARFATLGIGGGILFLPWFLHSLGGKNLERFFASVSTPAAAVSDWTKTYNDFGSLTMYMPASIWFLLLACLVWLAWKRSKAVWVFAAWFALILVGANPAWIGLPGTGILSNFAVLIAVYIPAGIFIGAAAADFVRAGARFTPAFAGLCAGLLVLAGLFGMRSRVGDIHPYAFSLAARPDQRAAQWIARSTPADARLLVNSFFAYNDGVIVGADGGWWLPLISQRSTNLPPITYDAEVGSRPDYSAWINDLVKQIQEKGLADPGVRDELSQRGITHLYIGQRQGRVNNPGDPVFDPDLLQADDHFRLVYHQDRVYIFEFLP